MRQAPEDCRYPLPEGWENLPEEYDIIWAEWDNAYRCIQKSSQQLQSYNDLPGRVQYGHDGQILVEIWYKNHLWHRKYGKPAYIDYYKNRTKTLFYYLHNNYYEPDQTEVNVRTLEEIL